MGSDQPVSRSSRISKHIYRATLKNREIILQFSDFAGEFMSIVKTIAIDGPAASGKSTVGKQVADALGYLFFDTGVMYRAVTWAAIERNIPIADETALTRLAEVVDIEVEPPSKKDSRSYDVWLDGRDATWDIRRPEVDANVSQVSAYPGVRRALSAQQRRIGQRGHVVMVGRDIGTVVLPESDLKIYLDASVEERARRRFEELRQRGEPANLEEITQALRKRDRIDSTRQIAPLRAASDAVIIHSDNLTFDQVVQKILRIIHQEAGR
jgi:cytidylate kinase